VRIAALSEPAFEALPMRRTIVDNTKAVKVAGRRGELDVEVYLLSETSLEIKVVPMKWN
jgi:hypothetical protein